MERLGGASLVVEYGDSLFARLAFGVAVENHRISQRPNQLMSVGGHCDVDRARGSIMEVSMGDINEALKVPQELPISAVREVAKIVQSLEHR